MFGYDRSMDAARRNPDVHYRIYLSTEEGEGAVVICVQDFDYTDYEDERFVGYLSFATEAEAHAALSTVKDDAARMLGLRMRPL